ncbi:hypothetical protein [Salana multivorans]
MDAACAFFDFFLSQDGQTLRLQDNGNALPSISGIDDLVTDSGKPANVAALIDMRDAGFANNAAEAAVQGLSLEISETVMLPLYQGKTDAAAALGQVADLLADAGTSD